MANSAEAAPITLPESPLRPSFVENMNRWTRGGTIIERNSQIAALRLTQIVTRTPDDYLFCGGIVLHPADDPEMTKSASLYIARVTPYSRRVFYQEANGDGEPVISDIMRLRIDYPFPEAMRDEAGYLLEQGNPDSPFRKPHPAAPASMDKFDVTYWERLMDEPTADPSVQFEALTGVAKKLAENQGRYAQLDPKFVDHIKSVCFDEIPS